jgi:O-6-methylguanine DNA methyltransferase
MLVSAAPLYLATLNLNWAATPPQDVVWGILPDRHVGRVMVGLTPQRAICRVAFAADKDELAILQEWQQAWPKTNFQADAQLTAEMRLLFAGEKIKQPIDILMVGTAFQQAVWQAMLAIPAGQVLSYGTVARQTGYAKASRAVGAACGANPVPLLVPCHRIIAGDGSLGGFGGGLATKKLLLRAEQVVLPILARAA